MSGPARARQRGAALVLATLGLGVALACLMVLDVAHVFTVKRELQKVADLAALAGASSPRDCTTMQARAGATASANAHASGDGREATFDCGTWSPAAGFAADSSAPTALRATVSRDVPYFFLLPGSRVVTAEAIARNDAYDVFSLGTGLASLHAGALNTLLSALLGTQVDLDLVSWQGLAASKVRLLDLVNVDSLGVGTVQELLNADLRLGELTLALARALERDNVLQATLLQTLAAKIPGSLGLRLSDLLQVNLPSPEAAGEVRLDALQLLLASAQIANAGEALNLSASLPSNSLATLDLRLRIVEPPRIAIGTEGVQARSAQVRLLLNARLLKLNLPLGLLSTSGLQLPLYVEAAQSVATLQRMECATAAEDCAVEFHVQPGIARACIGSEALLGAAGSSGCAGPAHLMDLKVELLGIPVATVDLQARADVQLADTAGQTVRFGRGGFTGSSVTDSHYVASANAGSTVGQLLAGLPDSLDIQPKVSLLGIPLSLIAHLLDDLVDVVTGAIGNLSTVVLRPLLTGLVGPLLETLGVRTGVADLHQIELHCGHAELVR